MYITRFMMESKFIVLNKVKEEAKLLLNLLENILYCPKLMAVFCVYYDSQLIIERV
jgi:hypothetical protein